MMATVEDVPNVVNVMDVVDARSQEITAAMEALLTQSSISVKQSIPFYMRRRAASHNPRRLPARVRPRDAVVTATKFKFKKQRTKKDDSTKATRLETHLWHAKRCHMRDLWGYRIAVSTTQKGARAAYRAVNQSTTLHDASFYSWISLGHASLRTELQERLRPNPFALNRALSAHLFDKTCQCLGPVTVFWVSPTSVFLRMHPAISHHTNLTELFSGLELKSYCVSQFVLNGVRAMELLTKSVELRGSPEVLEVWRQMKEDPYSYDIMKGTVIGGHAVVPPAKFRTFHPLQGCVIRQPSSRLSPQHKLDGNVLFEAQTEFPDLSFQDSADSVPCCIYRDPASGHMILVLPRGTGNRIWIPLVYNGGRVIGLEDIHSLATEQGLPHFPEDYPDTPAGRSYAESQSAEKEGKELRRPPQKRVRYAELGISHPFSAHWSSLVRDDLVVDRGLQIPALPDKSLVVVKVMCVSRGNVRPNARLYYTSTSPGSNPVYSPQDTYPIVGYVTSGGFCLSSGQGAGIGLILSSVWSAMNKEGVLLVRNTTTKHYRYVRVEAVK